MKITLPKRSAVLMLALLAFAGCASQQLEASQHEQQAADSLQRIGATQAAEAAQQRADKHAEAAKCNDAIECSLDVVGQLLLGLLGASSR